MPPAADFATVRAKYIGVVPGASSARTAGQLVDLLTRHAIFLSPKLSYASAMKQVLDAHPALKALYAS
jgi:hypothetical protein